MRRRTYSYVRNCRGQCQRALGIRSDGWWAAKRKVHAGTEGDDIVYLALQLGDSMLLDGRGQRGGLRCRSFDGIVWDVGRVANGDRPRELGHFIMRLALPIKTDTAMLESQYDKRTRLRRERAANSYVPPSAAPKTHSSSA